MLSTELKLNMHALLGIYRCPSGFEGERCDKVLSQLVMHTKNTDPFAFMFLIFENCIFHSCSIRSGHVNRCICVLIARLVHRLCTRLTAGSVAY